MPTSPFTNVRRHMGVLCTLHCGGGDGGGGGGMYVCVCVFVRVCIYMYISQMFCPFASNMNALSQSAAVLVTMC